MKKLSQKQIGNIGSAGEDAAVEYLESLGYFIEDRNAVFGKLEIDIVASDDKYVVFCEVKTRTEREQTSGRFGGPASAVTSEKRRNLKTAARQYLKSYSKRRIPRMDIIEVTVDRENRYTVNHIRNAF